MNFTMLFRYINAIAVCTCFNLAAATIPASSVSDDFQQAVENESIIDPAESRDVNATFFNDPYLEKQLDQAQQREPFNLIEEDSQPNKPEEQTLVDIPQDESMTIDKDYLMEADKNPAVVDLKEARDVDFTFFNDPYAFENFNNLPIKAKFGGYLQYSSWWDSRQVSSGGDGYVLLFPLPKLYDVDCNDINARGNYNGGFLETRLRAEFFGPKVVGAESYAYLETDFFGSATVVNRLRIRHAFMKLTWKPSELMLGQYWNPVFEPRCYPLTLDFGVGEPNATFARNPQIRYRYSKNKMEFMLIAAAQLEYSSAGPIGNSSTYLRNSRIPMLYARAAYDTEEAYIGTCIGYQRIVPRLESNTDYKVNESVDSIIALLFAKTVFAPLEIRQSIIYAQNASDLTLLGGYGVSSVNPVTDERGYTNIDTLSYWMDLNVTRKTEPGLFIGIVKNLGANKRVIQCLISPSTNIEEVTTYGLGLNMDTLFRIAPRVRFHVLPVDFCAEIEVVRAGYGCLNNKAQVKNIDPVTSVRLLLTTFFYF